MAPSTPRAAPGHWRGEPSAPASQVEGSAVAVGRYIYTVGGSAPGNLRTVLRFDPRARSWSRPTRLPVELNHSQPAAYRGDLYLAGGYLRGDTATNRAWRYRPASGRWSELPSMRRRRGAAGSAVIGDRLYVVGGGPVSFPRNYVKPYGALEIYDFKAGRWLAGPDMPTPRHHLVAAALDGKLYAVGGRDQEELSLAAFERYDPNTGGWEQLPRLPLGVAAAAAVGAAGKLIVFGGDDETDWQHGGGWVTPSAWSFDPRTRRWSRLPDLRVERRAHGGAAIGDRVYALTGSPCAGLGPKGPVGTRSVESLSVR